MSSQFLEENAMGNGVKGFTRVQVNIYSVSLTHLAHLVIGGDELSQARPAFHKLLLAGPDPLAALYRGLLKQI